MKDFIIKVQLSILTYGLEQFYCTKNMMEILDGLMENMQTLNQ
jgi:hypothetical protein